MNKFVDRVKKFEDEITNSEKFPLSGIFNVIIKDINFDVLTIASDDTSVTDRYWNKTYPDFTIEKWCDWSKEPGIFIDIGAHTGFYSLVSLKCSKKNYVIAAEPLPINFYRIISNLRLNNYDNSRASLLNMAISDKNGKVKFSTNTQWSYLSKGGRISENGQTINVIKLDSIKINIPNYKVNAIKIDTEGEDLKVLNGGINLIKTNKPKIIIETRVHNFEQIFKFLTGLGYDVVYTSTNNLITSHKQIEFEHNEVTKDIFFECSNN